MRNSPFSTLGMRVLAYDAFPNPATGCYNGGVSP